MVKNGGYCSDGMVLYDVTFAMAEFVAVAVFQLFFLNSKYIVLYSCYVKC